VPWLLSWVSTLPRDQARAPVNVASDNDPGRFYHCNVAAILKGFGQGQAAMSEAPPDGINQSPASTSRRHAHYQITGAVFFYLAGQSSSPDIDTALKVTRVWPALAKAYARCPVLP
jgi:hypothetical protein